MSEPKICFFIVPFLFLPFLFSKKSFNTEVVHRFKVIGTGTV